MDFAADQLAHVASDPFAQGALKFLAHNLCHKIAQPFFVKKLTVIRKTRLFIPGWNRCGRRLTRRFAGPLGPAQHVATLKGRSRRLLDHTVIDPVKRLRDAVYKGGMTVLGIGVKMFGAPGDHILQLGDLALEPAFQTRFSRSICRLFRNVIQRTHGLVWRANRRMIVLFRDGSGEISLGIGRAIITFARGFSL